MREPETPPCRRCGCFWRAHTHYRRPAPTFRAQAIWREYQVTENECVMCDGCPAYQRPLPRWLSSLLRV